MVTGTHNQRLFGAAMVLVGAFFTHTVGIGEMLGGAWLFLSAR